ncbi:MAG: ribosome maturation factor RimM [Candidatus Kapaibacterium sp.]|jgi:16S rRNA processing protein RimM
MDEYVLIARVRRSHGLKGEVFIETFTMDDTRFKKLKEVLLRAPDGTMRTEKVDSTRNTANGILIKFSNTNDRNAADLLRNTELLIPESERMPLPEGKAYFDQIIGMKVVDDATNEELGKVRDVLEMPAGTVYVIDLLTGEEHLVTTAGEEVKKVDVKKNEVRVSFLEELN